MKHNTIIPLLRLSSLYESDPKFKLIVEQVEEYATLDFEMESLHNKRPNVFTVLSGITISILSFLLVFTPNRSREFTMAIIAVLSICTLGIIKDAIQRLKGKMCIQNGRLSIKIYLEEIVCTEYLLEIEKLLIQDECIKSDNTEIIEKFFQVVRAILELDPKDYVGNHTAQLYV